jgi:histidine triad (HIT) family protein
MKTKLLLSGMLLASLGGFAQKLTVEEYATMKSGKLSEKSPFEKIVDRELPATIVFENEHVVAFVPLKPQARVHYLIVPKKRINTVNDVTESDVEVMGRLFLAAKAVAEKTGIAESGYRLAINTNRDAGQSEFHVHMHLLGGEFLGPMTSTR